LNIQIYIYIFFITFYISIYYLFYKNADNNFIFKNLGYFLDNHVSLEYFKNTFFSFMPLYFILLYYKAARARTHTHTHTKITNLFLRILNVSDNYFWKDFLGI